MTSSSARHRRVPTGEPLEPRDLTAGLGLATTAATLSNSPLVAAARSAALAYQVGQLAWAGHTRLLLGTVEVTQPHPLKDLRGDHTHPRPASGWLASELPRVRLRRPAWLARVVHLGTPG
jgi:hypothetical protein